MNIRFLGSASSIPDKNNDCPCFLINGKYLVDCGYNVLTQLRNRDTDISKIEYIIFTHMHHDHYIGLAGLLFFMMQSKQKNIGDLTFIGPETMPEVLKRTYNFLQLDKFFLGQKMPKEIVLNEGEFFENDDVLISAGISYHPVSARCYRFEDKISKKVLAITGDTAYKADMKDLFKNANAIIHDCTLGASHPTDAPETRSCGHSSVYEAIKLCEEANIPILFPVHMNDADCLYSIKEAQPTTKVDVKFPSKDFDYILY